MDARLEGRETSEADVDASERSRDGRGPKDKREMPLVERRGTCFVASGVSSEPEVIADEIVDPPVRLRLRIVTLLGIALPPEDSSRGDALGGVYVGAGSLDRADWTLCSRR